MALVLDASEDVCSVLLLGLRERTKATLTPDVLVAATVYGLGQEPFRQSR